MRKTSEKSEGAHAEVEERGSKGAEASSNALDLEAWSEEPEELERGVEVFEGTSSLVLLTALRLRGYQVIRRYLACSKCKVPFSAQHPMGAYAESGAPICRKCADG